MSKNTEDTAHGQTENMKVWGPSYILQHAILPPQQLTISIDTALNGGITEGTLTFEYREQDHEEQNYSSILSWLNDWSNLINKDKPTEDNSPY